MLRNLYYRLPAPLQDALVTLEGYRVRRQRLGSEFQARLKDYLERDDWDEERLTAYKMVRRAAALEQAAQAPFYRAWFAASSADWRDFVEADSFRELPIIRKSDLIADLASFLPRPPLRTDRTISTSGTTGTSFQFPISTEVEPDQWAVWWRYRIRHGIRPGTPCALFASAPILAPGDSGRPYRINRAGQEVRFSIFHISTERVGDYVQAFQRHGLRWVHGNPTAIAQFCVCYLESGRAGPIEIDHLTAGSENLTPWQVEAMQAVFGMTPRQHYGLAEPVANISELPDGRLAVDEDFAYAEFVDDPDHDLKHIVGTAFCNTALALLRYDTGDLCALAEGSGRDDVQRYVETLDGRSTDYVQLPGGRRAASLAGPFHGTPGLGGAQLVQHADRSLTVRYIPGQGWRGEAALIDLEAALRKRIGPELALRFEQVDSIPKTARGKSRLVISELASPDTNSASIDRHPVSS